MGDLMVDTGGSFHRSFPRKEENLGLAQRTVLQSSCGRFPSDKGRHREGLAGLGSCWRRFQSGFELPGADPTGAALRGGLCSALCLSLTVPVPLGVGFGASAPPGLSEPGTGSATAFAWHWPPVPISSPAVALWGVCPHSVLPAALTPLQNPN